MSSEENVRTPYEIIEQEKKAYLEELPESDPEWPPDVSAVYNYISAHLFDFNLQVQDILRRCGCHNNNISTRFRYFVGRGPKEEILHHRVSVAQSLLQTEDLKVGDVALAMGFSNPSAFTRAFKKRIGQTPSQHASEEKKQDDSKE